jgi:hypothetical protein
MKAVPWELKWLLIATGVAVTIWLGLVVTGVGQFRRAHELATFSLAGGYKIRVSIEHHFDIADSVLCKLSGPSFHHSASYIAAIGADELRPPVVPVGADACAAVRSRGLPMPNRDGRPSHTGKRYPLIPISASE